MDLKVKKLYILKNAENCSTRMQRNFVLMLVLANSANLLSTSSSSCTVRYTSADCMRGLVSNGFNGDNFRLVGLRGGGGPTIEPELKARLEKLVNTAPVMLFMKGNSDRPQVFPKASLGLRSAFDCSVFGSAGSVNKL
jgi:hypothetical protein